MTQEEIDSLYARFQNDLVEWIRTIDDGTLSASTAKRRGEEFALRRAVEREREKSEDIRLALEECKAVIDEYLPDMRDRAIRAINQRITARRTK